MRLRIRETGAVVYDNEFRALHPDTSFPLVLSAELLNDFGADPVLEGPQPPLTENQYARYDGVEEISGQWFTKYVAVDYTEEELAARVEQWRQSASCTPARGRIALSNAGFLSQVEALIASPETPSETKIYWEYALSWERNSPMITALATALNITDEQVDTLFKEAASVQA